MVMISKVRRNFSIFFFLCTCMKNPLFSGSRDLTILREWIKHRKIKVSKKLRVDMNHVHGHGSTCLFGSCFEVKHRKIENFKIAGKYESRAWSWVQLPIRVSARGHRWSIEKLNDKRDGCGVPGSTCVLCLGDHSRWSVRKQGTF